MSQFDCITNFNLRIQSLLENSQDAFKDYQARVILEDLIEKFKDKNFLLDYFSVDGLKICSQLKSLLKSNISNEILKVIINLLNTILTVYKLEHEECSPGTWNSFLSSDQIPSSFLNSQDYFSNSNNSHSDYYSLTSSEGSCNNSQNYSQVNFDQRLIPLVFYKSEIVHYVIKKSSNTNASILNLSIEFFYNFVTTLPTEKILPRYENGLRLIIRNCSVELGNPCLDKQIFFELCHYFISNNISEKLQSHLASLYNCIFEILSSDEVLRFSKLLFDGKKNIPCLDVGSFIVKAFEKINNSINSIQNGLLTNSDDIKLILHLSEIFLSSKSSYKKNGKFERKILHSLLKEYLFNLFQDLFKSEDEEDISHIIQFLKLLKFFDADYYLNFKPFKKINLPDENSQFLEANEKNGFREKNFGNEEIVKCFYAMRRNNALMENETAISLWNYAFLNILEAGFNEIPQIGSSFQRKKKVWKVGLEKLPKLFEDWPTIFSRRRLKTLDKRNLDEEVCLFSFYFLSLLDPHFFASLNIISSEFLSNISIYLKMLLARKRIFKSEEIYLAIYFKIALHLSKFIEKKLLPFKFLEVFKEFISDSSSNAISEVIGID